MAGLALVLFDVYPFIREYVPAEWQAYLPAALLPWVEAIDGTMYMGAILIVTAVVLLSLTRLALPGGSLLITALGMMLLIQPYHWFVTPSMGKILSPVTQAAATADQPKEALAPAAPAAPAVAAKPAEAAPAEQPQAAPAEAPAAEAQPTPAEEPAKAEPAAPAAPADSAPEAAPEAQPEAPAAPAEPQA